MSYKLIPRFKYTFSFLRYLYFIVKVLIGRKTEFLFNGSRTVESMFFFNHARSGLFTLLKSVGKQNLRVGVQVYTCKTVMQAITEANHQIVFIDINDHYGLNIKDLSSKIDQIDILIVTHTFGIPDNLESIKQIAKGKIMLEDCAHSFLSTYKDTYTGFFGDASIFSFGFGKLPPIGQGGAVVINNNERFPGFESNYINLSKISFRKEVSHVLKTILYSILLNKPIYGLVSHNIGKKLDARFDFIKKNRFNISSGFRFDRKVLLQNMSLFKKMVEDNKANFGLLKSKSNSNSWNIELDFSFNISPNAYVLPLRTEKCDDLYHYLIKNDFEAGMHFKDSIEWAKNYGYEEGHCPEAEEIALSIITIPLYSGISRKKIHELACLLDNYFQPQAK